MNKEKKRLVFYFTGTGNSLYVARKLCENPLSIPEVLKGETSEFAADEIGIVYPIYGHIPPHIVSEFIRRVKLNAPYLFAIMTYGFRTCSAAEILEKLAAENGLHFNYVTSIKMVDNFLPAFDMNEQIKMDKHEEEHIAMAAKDIDNHRNWVQPVSEEERRQHAEFMQRAGYTLTRKAEDTFIISDKCIKCGICTKVCPRSNYSLTEKSAACKGKCEYCLACIQNCPQKAIMLKDGEKNPDARYRHPGISLMDIIKSNRQ